LAATLELNPRAETLLSPLFTGTPIDPQMREAALAGMMMPDFTTRLRQSSDFPVPPHFRPDYALRLRLVEGWRAVVTDERTLQSIDRARERLLQRTAETAPAQ
jgi:hypothetical protein